MTVGDRRRTRLERARLYFVVDATAADRVEPALEGGADIVQLRDKEAADAVLVATARGMRAVCERFGALFVVNDRPDLARAAGADGVHVGQGDMAPEEVRGEVGGDVLIGVSTHDPEQFDAAQSGPADYVSAGPVHATPTKPGRPAAGLELIGHAAHAATPKPWFAIGGIDRSNVGEVVRAGAERIVVVRAIRDANDPRAAARELRAAVAKEGAGV